MSTDWSFDFFKKVLKDFYVEIFSAKPEAGRTVKMPMGKKASSTFRY